MNSSMNISLLQHARKKERNRKARCVWLIAIDGIFGGKLLRVYPTSPHVCTPRALA